MGPEFEHPPASTAWDGSPGSEIEERVGGRGSYLDVLDRLHRELRPAHYLEIGIRHGRSLALAKGIATGVDPAPEIDVDLPMTTTIVRLTSDDFFEQNAGGCAPDFCFIDGLHLFEYALRDFMNIERCAAPGAIVVVDDIFPNHPVQAERIRRTCAWTGDIWRLADILRAYRPDLFLLSLDVAPAGLLLVAGLDSGNKVLWDNYDEILQKARAVPGPSQQVLKRVDAIDPSERLFSDIIETLKSARSVNSAPGETCALLRQTLRVGFAAHVPAPPKLSVVVIGYNMARELPRTIHSLSPNMQQGISAQDYEVILIDNGSSQCADEAQLRLLCPNLVTYRFPNATVSPVPAINFGLSVARGDLVGVCIDGARIASPGLLAKALAAARLHERPMIGTIAFHLGSELQMDSVKRGYNQQVEDELLSRSDWEADGYRLFDISTFAGSSIGGWFDLPAESNAVFLRADHWRALNGWDERFVTPGGGLANLDMWSRICADEEGELIMLLGEATFHQVHGGIATNSLNPPQALFHDEYVRIRGFTYRRPLRRPLYFGSLPDAAKPSFRKSVECI